MRARYSLRAFQHRWSTALRRGPGKQQPNGKKIPHPLSFMPHCFVQHFDPAVSNWLHCLTSAGAVFRLIADHPRSLIMLSSRNMLFSRFAPFSLLRRCGERSNGVLNCRRVSATQLRTRYRLKAAAAGWSPSSTIPGPSPSVVYWRRGLRQRARLPAPGCFSWCCRVSFLATHRRHFQPRSPAWFRSGFPFAATAAAMGR